MSTRLPKTHMRIIYSYIKMHDGQTLLQKNISADTGVGKNTVSRDLNYLTKRKFIRREGKNYSVIPESERY